MSDSTSLFSLITEKSKPNALGYQDFHDLRIECNCESWLVHRVIICPKSAFFLNACTGEWLESTSRKIELHDDDPETVEKMLKYMYGQYSDATTTLHRCDEECDKEQNSRGPSESVQPTSTVPENRSQLQGSLGKIVGRSCAIRRDSIYARLCEHVQLFEIADKYDVPELLKTAKWSFFDELCRLSPELPISMLPKVFLKVYEATHDSARGLRDIVKSYMRHIDMALLQEDVFQRLMQISADFVLDMNSALLSRYLPPPGTHLLGNRRFCLHCQTVQETRPNDFFITVVIPDVCCRCNRANADAMRIMPELLKYDHDPFASPTPSLELLVCSVARDCDMAQEDLLRSQHEIELM